MDILTTMTSCIESFALPDQSVAPHASHLWNSLKYEVRNGEAQESVSGTLDTIKALSRTLANVTAEKPDGASLGDFVSMVLADCIGDVSNPAYVRPAGLLITAVAGTSVKAFNMSAPRVFQAARATLTTHCQKLHARDLVSLLNDMLAARYTLLDERENDQTGPPPDELHSVDPLVRELTAGVYLRLWEENMVDEPDTGQIALLKEIMRGFGSSCANRALPLA